MNNLKLLILEANERSKKIKKLELQHKKEKEELQMIKNYIVKEMQSYPSNNHGDRKIKLNMNGSEKLITIDKNGNCEIIHNVISL